MRGEWGDSNLPPDGSKEILIREENSYFAVSLLRQMYQDAIVR